MTDEKLCELMELRAAATPGPWKHDIASSVPELVQQIRELSGTVTRLGLMLADAAEFEARVAKKMATVICGECEEFNKKPNCPISIYQAHGLYECRMKHARLSVEAEMIREGKGPGSPEVK